MLVSAIALLSEHGARATTIDQVLAHSGAPRGSVYHHFPEGRTQLIDEAVGRAGGQMTGLIEAAAEGDEPVQVVERYLAAWSEQLERSSFRMGCPIVAVAVETNDDAPELARTAGAVFADWQEAFAAMLRSRGLEEQRSRRLAAMIVAAVEGAVVLARAQQDIAPMQDVAAEVCDLVSHALADAR